MARTTENPKESSFNLRIDSALKSAFTEAAAAADRPAAQLVRDFMRFYVRRRARGTFESEARRQSLLVAARAGDPDSDEFAVMREIEAELENEAFWRE